MKRYLIFTLPLLLTVFGCGQENQNEKIKFNREEWLHGDWRTRGKMVDNIIEDSTLIGKSKMEVLSLLGEQGDTTDNFSYQVDIGLKTGPFGLGGVWLFDLNIHFDTLTNIVFEVRCND
ncbi:MAG: hypothetical protein IPL31_00115 [Saprospiraceae bacterium]|nr:hypothetical protein [Saprospiraceae bacterium]